MAGAVRRWLRRLGLGLGGLVVGLVLAELLARLWTPNAGTQLYFNTPDTLPDNLYRSHPTLAIEPTPGFDQYVSSVDYLSRVRINGLGLRNPELDPADKRPRWLAVGDSFTMALQVSEERTFAGVLSDKLGINVLNAGVDGYSTWQEERRYELLDQAAGTSAVLVTFFVGNDLSDNITFTGRSSHGPMAQSFGVKNPVWTGQLWRWIRTRSAVAAYFDITAKTAAIQQGIDPDGKRLAQEMAIFTKSGAADLQRRADATRQALAAFRDATAQRGDKLYVAVAPPYFAVDPRETDRTLRAFGLKDPDLDAPVRLVMGLLSELGIASCDLSADLRKVADDGGNAYFRYDGHWSAEGHAAAAGAMARCFGG